MSTRATVFTPPTRLYPPPPWGLFGTSGFAVRLIPVHHVRQQIPAPLEVYAFPGDLTLGGVYAALYQTPPPQKASSSHVLSFPDHSFGEFGLVAGLARYRHHRGFFISHMFVDSPAACNGGINEWGLNKKYGLIRPIGWINDRGCWDPGVLSSSGVLVNAGKRFQARVLFRRWSPWVPWRWSFSFLSVKSGKVLKYRVRFQGSCATTLPKTRLPKSYLDWTRHGWQCGGVVFKNAWVSISPPEQLD